MTRAERLLVIVEALRGRRSPVTARALAERFGVSERSIYRDIATLNRLGAVIEGGSGLGYVLRTDFFLPPIAFDVEEAAAIMLGLRFVLRHGDDALTEAAASARGKLTAASPVMFDDAAAFSSPLLVAPPAISNRKTLGIVRDALMRERKLQIDYLDAADLKSERLIWPVALGWFDGLVMVAAWCEARNAFRTFRLDRITKAQLVDEQPPRPRRRLLAEYRKLEPGISL